MGEKKEQSRYKEHGGDNGANGGNVNEVSFCEEDEKLKGAQRSETSQRRRGSDPLLEEIVK